MKDWNVAAAIVALEKDVVHRTPPSPVDSEAHARLCALVHEAAAELASIEATPVAVASGPNRFNDAG